ncbi:NADPH-dependent F420 reductase [Elizabethkingia bruuniana]|uniref:NADPH-dependent F420 reductase n=1 Tax=Elizabethkingia bruuniana TaxID=1756149 RepID=UPI00241EE8AB|nr:NAD(P)-binding domain-containing protein [Elizabethkingia bruuniana]
MNTTTKVAIIGLGNIGKAIASDLTKGNYPVILASRELGQAQELSSHLGASTTPMEIAEAIKEADVIIPTIYYDKIKEFLKTYAQELQGKIIIDVSNPIAPDENGGFKKIISENESAGKNLSALLPPNSILVKAFGTLAAATLTNAAFNIPERKVLFYASDNIKTNKVVEELITASGFVPFHIGGIDQSIRIEVFGDLHEFGALGKTVTLDEARQIVTNS